MLIWRVNVTSQTLRREPAPEAYERLGGRGLLAQILVDEVDATCDPLGPANKLIFAPGLLVDHMLSSCDRISVGGKSPLTGGVKESNAGGRTGLQLTLLGIKALILEGQPRPTPACGCCGSMPAVRNSSRPVIWLASACTKRRAGSTSASARRWRWR
jgi:aldehyde:ferredoxin oxidoreductase